MFLGLEILHVLREGGGATSNESDRSYLNKTHRLRIKYQQTQSQELFDFFQF